MQQLIPWLLTQFPLGLFTPTAKFSLACAVSKHLRHIAEGGLVFDRQDLGRGSDLMSKTTSTYRAFTGCKRHKMTA